MIYLKVRNEHKCCIKYVFDTMCKRKRIPFIPSLEVPNARLISAMEEVEAIESGKIKAKKYKSFEDALEDID